jgi:hypothetical protein
MLSFNDLAHRLALQISQYSSPTRGCFRVVSNASPSEIAEDLGRTRFRGEGARSCETNCPWALAIYREDAGKMIQPRPRAYAEGEGEMTFTARVSAARD